MLNIPRVLVPTRLHCTVRRTGTMHVHDRYLLRPAGTVMQRISEAIDGGKLLRSEGQISLLRSGIWPRLPGRLTLYSIV